MAPLQTISLALIFVLTVHAQATSNDTCAQSGGVCGQQVMTDDDKQPRRTHYFAAGKRWMDADDELLGQMEKDRDSHAMHPAAFPTYLPPDSVGSSTVKNLPQPRLTRSHADAAPPSRVFMMGGVMDPSIALGLY